MSGRHERHLRQGEAPVHPLPYASTMGGAGEEDGERKRARTFYSWSHLPWHRMYCQSDQISLYQ